MGFAGPLTRLQDAVFRRFGDPASWPGIVDPVLVITRTQDVEQQFQGGTLIGERRMLRVRQSDVPTPEDGMTIVLVATGEEITLTGEPQLDRKGVWHCPIPD